MGRLIPSLFWTVLPCKAHTLYMKVSRGYHEGIMKVSRGRILCVLYVAYSTQRRHYILTAWPEYAMLFNIPCSRPWNSSRGRS